MNPLNSIYRTSLALLTDLYQLTMAHGYWKLGRAEQEAVFNLFFRKPPFGGGYAIAAGLAHVVDLLADFRFDDSDIEYLATLTGNDGKPLFEPEFLRYLKQCEFTCDVDAVPEGTVVFGMEPMVRVKGPILQCQILETILLNIVNFQTLIAAKASRICRATGGELVLEFGLRRAQGIDGALTASRAAHIGGCAATSNVLAGKLYGIPVKGTHAHSWVMSFDTEMDAFEGYAAAMPNNCVFLVDTYDTIVGVQNAIEVGIKLREQGHKMVGIRLDSGDLAYLSIQARHLLDEAGLEDAAIVASNDLDEFAIEKLKEQGAKIAVWGVGTKLATSYDQPALGGVYKLGAIKDENNDWQRKVKLSEQSIKTTIPGSLQIRRFESDGKFIGDAMYDELSITEPSGTAIQLGNSDQQKSFTGDAKYRDLLVPVARNGKVVYEAEPIDVIRNRAADELAKLSDDVLSFKNPAGYFVGLEQGLSELRERLITEARNQSLETPEGVA